VLAAGQVLALDLSVELYIVASYAPFDAEAGCYNLDWCVGVIVGRVMRLVSSGVSIVAVADCPYTSPAKAAEQARRRAAKAATSAPELDAEDEGGVSTASGKTGPPRGGEASIDVHGALQSAVIEALEGTGIVSLRSPAEAGHQMPHMCAVGQVTWTCSSSVCHCCSLVSSET